jgi:hypothetical protein
MANVKKSIKTKSTKLGGNNINKKESAKSVKDYIASIVLNIFNISRSEKIVSLINPGLNDKSINIESGFSNISYEQILRKIYISNYKLSGIYISNIFSQKCFKDITLLELTHSQKQIDASEILQPLNIYIDPHQFQPELAYISLEDKNILLNSLSDLTFKIQSRSEIQLRFFIKPIL